MKTYLGTRPASDPKDVQAQYGYPEDCYVEVIRFSGSDRQVADRSIHEITYHGAPAALFNNAPLGSRLWDTSTPSVNLKTAAAGTGTWVTETLS